MSVIMYKWVAYSTESSDTTNYSVVRDDIVRQAYERCGILDKNFSDAATDALNRIAKKFHQLGVPGWKVQQTNNALVASSEVTNGGTNYTCILPHTSSTASEPGVGSEWEVFWAEAGESGTAWVTATNYVSASVIAANSDVISLEKATIIINGSTYELTMHGRFDFDNLNKNSPFGNPAYVWFERLRETAFYHLHPFPNNDDVGDVILITKDVVLLGDFDVGDDGPDFPVTYIDVLVALLAVDVAFIERDRVPRETRLDIQNMARSSLMLAQQDMQREPDDNPRIYGAY